MQDEPPFDEEPQAKGRSSPSLRGRGTSANPRNRFESLHFEPDPEQWEEETPRPATQFFRDHSRSILSRNASPDVGFDVSLNPYRGCEHGCSYCYARPYHEYLGFSSGLDFETRIVVKEDAPELLRQELSSPRWKPELIGLSGVTDPYQPVERKLALTRRCIAVLAEFRNPVAIITKNELVTRDRDLLGELAAHHAAAVFLSLTTLDATLSGRLEPRAARPERRLRAITELRDAGVPVGVLVAPIIPGLTDHEVPSILQAAANAGASHAGSVVLRLPHAVGPIFEDWLERHYPGHRSKVLSKLRALRGGELHDGRFGIRMRGQGILAEQIGQLFGLGCERAGLRRDRIPLSTRAFRSPHGRQLSLFEGLGGEGSEEGDQPGP